jgi:predicted membrane-bound mannosyltransferase
MEATIRVPARSRWRALWEDLTPAERLAWAMLLAAAVFTRLWRLGERVMSHDESLHVYYAYELFKGKGLWLCGRSSPSG